MRIDKETRWLLVSVVLATICLTSLLVLFARVR